MKKTILGMTMTLALAGVSFAAQTTPAPAAKPAAPATTNAAPAAKVDSKTEKKTSKHHSSKAKGTKKVESAAPAK